MKTNLRLVWLAPVLALCAAVRGNAQEAASGRVLILENDRVLEGEISKLGGQYRIRRGASEALLDGSRAKQLCRDWDDALRYMRTQANLGDADERLRLALWCQQHQLKEQALVEASAAAEMRPEHPQTKQLLQVLTRPPASAAPAAGSGPVVARDSGPRLDMSADCVALFTTKVQPILMNACASCHADGQSGAFQIARVGDGSARATTLRNLAATMHFVKLDAPASSALLVKAVAAHGALPQSPIRDRRTPAFLTLLQWVEKVAANNPHLRDAPVSAPTVAAAARAPSSVEVAVSSPPPMPQEPIAATVISRSLPRNDNQVAPSTAVNYQQALVSQQSPLPTRTPSPAPAVAASVAPAVAPAVAPSANPRDPFDPVAFNRQATPSR